MPTVTFYKTNMNRSNRAYDEAALSAILTAAPSLSVTIGNQVIPNTPFAINSSYVEDSTNEAEAMGQDIILAGYDYISYDYAGKTWYAFIDDIQPLATAEGQLFISHTTDKWAMCIVYFADRFKLQGSLVRAHVNDLEASSNSNYNITMANTTGTQEAPFNKSRLKTGRARPSQPMFSDSDDNAYPYLWCYIYISNPAEIRTAYQYDISNSLTSLNNDSGDYRFWVDFVQIHNIIYDEDIYANPQDLDNSIGITLCYIAVPTKYILDQMSSGDRGTIANELICNSEWCLLIPNWEITSQGEDITVNGYIIQPLSDLTASAITSISLLPIAPARGLTISNRNATIAGIFSKGEKTDLDYTIRLPILNTNSPYTYSETQGWTVVAAYEVAADELEELKTGLPYTLQLRQEVTPTRFYEPAGGSSATDAVTDIPDLPIKKQVTITDDYSEYIQNIPKYLTSIYHPIYLGDTFLDSQALDWLPDAESLGTVIYLSVSLDLSVVYYYIESDQIIGKKVFSTPNLNAFSNNATLDYWTRLNSTQATISANKSIFGSAMNIVSSVVGAANSLAQPIRRLVDLNSTNRQIDVGTNSSSGAINIANSIGNAIYTIQGANITKEIAEQQYNAGETTDGANAGAAGLAGNSSMTILSWTDNSNNQEMICLNLHRYGYSTFLPIDEIYANHRRKYFNYFQGVDVTCSGLPQAWCDEIATMFNSGVTLWHAGATVEDYEVCNYQEGVLD